MYQTDPCCAYCTYRYPEGDETLFDCPWLNRTNGKCYLYDADEDDNEEEEWDKFFFYSKAVSGMVVTLEPEGTEHRLQLIDFITVNDQDYLFAHLKGTNASIMVIRAVQTQEGLQLEKVSDPEERRMAWQAWSEMGKKRKEIKETRKAQLDELGDNERPF